MSGGVGQDVAQQQDLADPVEHVRARRQPGVGRVLGQDPMAEAVEVRHRDARPDRRARRVASSRSRSSRAAFTL